MSPRFKAPCHGPSEFAVNFYGLRGLFFTQQMSLVSPRSPEYPIINHLVLFGFVLFFCGMRQPQQNVLPPRFFLLPERAYRQALLVITSWKSYCGQAGKISGCSKAHEFNGGIEVGTLHAAARFLESVAPFAPVVGVTITSTFPRTTAKISHSARPHTLGLNIVKSLEKNVASARLVLTSRPKSLRWGLVVSVHACGNLR